MRGRVRRSQILRGDPETSLRCVELLEVALSRPKDWRFNVRGLCRYTAEGPDAIKRAIKSLKKKGYVNREKIRKDGRFQGIEYEFFEHPSLNRKYSEVDFPPLETPQRAEQEAEKSVEEKRQIFNILPEKQVMESMIRRNPTIRNAKGYLHGYGVSVRRLLIGTKGRPRKNSGACCFGFGDLGILLE